MERIGELTVRTALLCTPGVDENGREDGKDLTPENPGDGDVAPRR